MSKQHENTPLIAQSKTLPSKTEYIQPFLMMLASGANVVGGFFAIAAGADQVKQDNGDLKTNPFFYTAMSTSLLYFGANLFEVGRIYQRRQATWTEMVNEQRAAETKLTEVSIAR